MKSKQEIIEQWEQIKIKHAFFLEQKRKNLLPPKGGNERYVGIAKDMVVKEIDSEFVYTVYGAHQEGGLIGAIMDELKNDVKHFEQTFSELAEQVDAYLMGQDKDQN